MANYKDMENIWKVVLSAAVAFVYVFATSKILGKKQLAELDFVSYVSGIIIGSIAAEMSTELDDKPIYVFLISMSVIFLMDFVVTMLCRKSRVLDKVLRGSPLILIVDGQLDYKALKKSNLTLAELMGMIRDKNCFDINNIAYGVFESNGKFSILLKSEQAPPTAQDLKVKTQAPAIKIALVNDGRISKFGLKAAGISQDKLFKKLKVTPKSIKEILLATIDPSTGSIDIHYKNTIPVTQLLKS